MSQVTSEEIAEFRTQLADYPKALAALDEIEECEGDIEDAAINLAIKVGQQPEIANTDWLQSLAKKCRTVICQAEYREDLLNGNLAPMFKHLVEAKLCPGLLVVPVLIYVIKQGVQQFCQPLDPVL